MSTYKTVDGQDYTIPGVGQTTNGQIETDQVIESALFVKVDPTAPVNPDAGGINGTQAPQDNVVTEAAPVPAQTKNNQNIGDEL